MLSAFLHRWTVDFGLHHSHRNLFWRDRINDGKNSNDDYKQNLFQFNTDTLLLKTDLYNIILSSLSLRSAIAVLRVRQWRHVNRGPWGTAPPV